jgi:hypothetical protein
MPPNLPGQFRVRSFLSNPLCHPWPNRHGEGNMTSNAPSDSSILNYISEDDLRESLVCDFREMEAACKAESWKSVQVLAGSIVEALLIDYLLAIRHAGKPEGDILKMELGAAISACVSEKLLDETTEKLCSVIRDYRNLIHPGRVKRLQQPVTQETAEIAMRLVRMVANKTAKRRREQYGYTAQEVMAKIECDSTAFPGILPALLKKLPQSERKRLLLKLLPERNSELRCGLILATENDFFVPSHRKQIRCVSLCFRQLFQSSDPETVSEVVNKHLRILHSGAEMDRRHYEYAFFRARDIAHYPHPDRATLVNHVFSILEPPDAEALACTEGLGPYLLSGPSLTKHINVLLETAIHGHQIPNADAVAWLRDLVTGMSQPVSKALMKELAVRATAISSDGDWRTIDRVREIQLGFGLEPIPRLQGDPIPF